MKIAQIAAVRAATEAARLNQAIRQPLEALRVARGRDQAHTISASKTATASPLEVQAQVTKQGTVIQKVGEHEIRHTSKGLNVEPNVGDDVLIELIGRAAERYEGCLTAYGPADFQLRIARVGFAGHTRRFLRSNIGCRAWEFQSEPLSSRISPPG